MIRAAELKAIGKNLNQLTVPIRAEG